MKRLRVLWLILLLTVTGLLSAEPLMEFYDSLYVAQDVESVRLAYGSLIDHPETLVNDIAEATSVLSGFNANLVSEYLQNRYLREPGNFNVTAAWICNQADGALATRAARKLIMLHRSKADAYKLLVMAHLHRMPAPEDSLAWEAFNRDLVSDTAYFRRFSELATDDVLVHYGLMINAVASSDMESASAALDGILNQRRILSEELDIDKLVLDPAYRSLIQRYVMRVEAAFGDLSDIEPIFNIAVSLATYYVNSDQWTELLETFDEEGPFWELGMVMIGLLRGHQAQNDLEGAYQILEQKGVDTAVEIISWWRAAYPELGVTEFLAAMQAAKPDDSLVQALLLESSDDPRNKVLEAKRYIERDPESTYGYKALMQAYAEIFMSEPFSPESDEPDSRAFVEDLALLRALGQRDQEQALNLLLEMLETYYYGASLNNIIATVELLPEYLEQPQVQYMMVNAQFNLQNYDAVLPLLQRMYHQGTLSLEDLEALESQENPICSHPGWQPLMESIRAEATTEDNIPEGDTNE